jgi:hypothetical protein
LRVRFELGLFDPTADQPYWKLGAGARVVSWEVFVQAPAAICSTTIAPRCVLIASFLQGPRHGQKRADENGAELQENMVCRIILFDVPSGKLT